MQLLADDGYASGDHVHDGDVDGRIEQREFASAGDAGGSGDGLGSCVLLAGMAEAQELADAGGAGGWPSWCGNGKWMWGWWEFRVGRGWWGRRWNAAGYIDGDGDCNVWDAAGDDDVHADGELRHLDSGKKMIQR
jgi:hypothetical protein